MNPIPRQRPVRADESNSRILNPMKTREASPSFSVISKVLAATLLLLLCLVVLLSYALLGRTQTVQSSHSPCLNFAQLTADVRTVTAAISYILEPESANSPPLPAMPNIANRVHLLESSDSPFVALTKSNRFSRNRT